MSMRPFDCNVMRASPASNEEPSLAARATGGRESAEARAIVQVTATGPLRKRDGREAMKPLIRTKGRAPRPAAGIRKPADRENIKQRRL